MRVLVALGLLATVQGAAVLRNYEQELVENQWIVVFHDNITEEMRADHMLKLGKTPVIAEYKHSIKGYAIANTPEDEVFKLSEDPMIKYIEQDGVARASCENLNRPQHWGLRRVSQAARGGTDLRRARNAGQGVDVYIIDTGIYVQHSDFAGRAEHVFDCTGQGAGDGNGHGTHCASTAAGNGHGIASDAKLFAVKVLNAGGSGTWACVTQGVDFVAGRTGQRVGSMSLGGGRQQAVNDAVDAAVTRGAAMISASGNSNANACNFSPASARNGLTVNSMQDNDARSGFSNWGTCTHIFAPGTNILGAWIGNPTATRTISGTSMACPHVAGIVAEVWSQNSGLTAVQVQNEVVQQGARDIITNPGTGSPNILAQTSCAQ